jgi:hypothetical protein
MSPHFPQNRAEAYLWHPFCILLGIVPYIEIAQLNGTEAKEIFNFLVKIQIEYFPLGSPIGPPPPANLQTGSKNLDIVYGGEGSVIQFYRHFIH